MKTRFDVSDVPLQGGYIAKQCPVVIQNRMLVPELEAAVPVEVQLRADEGIAFEADLLPIARSETSLDWVVIEGPPASSIARTLEAMDARVAVIEQAFLPYDGLGRRTGKPDLLVHFDGGYVPVDVKHHRTLDDAEPSTSVSPSDKPTPEAAYKMEGKSLRKHLGDALQLAHYRRMLEAAGYASTTPLAGILGKEQMVVWYDLEEPMWTTPAKSDGKKRKVRSSLERYDFEFGFRLDVAATALAKRSDDDIALIVEPMACGECGYCGFKDFCFERLLEGSGDASLLPGVSYQHWRSLRDLGIRQREEVAALHYPTAAMAKEGADVQAFLDLAAGLEQTTSVTDLRPRAHKQLSILAENGISTVGDLISKTDELTSSIGGFIAPRILDARAALGPEPVYRQPGSRGDQVPRADIEIDIDMENVNDGVYLWGVLVTDRAGSGEFDAGSFPFFSWKMLDDHEELAIFFSMWEWLTGVRSKASELGLSLRCYVWHEPAENTQLRRIAKRADQKLEGHVEDLIASDQWVDLKKVFADGWLTGGSVGLKSIAPLAGFAWEVDDPGGGLSMVKYVQAVDKEEESAAEARQWLLDYNRGDVLATLQIRDWLDEFGATWPEVTTN